MNKPIYLKIDTDNVVITIPFLGIKEVDNFTVLYKNMDDLVEALIKLLKLPINLYDVTDAYLTYYQYNRSRDENSFVIKYTEDNFNFSSLEEAFVIYLKDDPKRIFKTDIRYVKTAGILKYFGTGIIDTYEIENEVRKYFASGTGYKRKRDTYFLIKDDVDVKIDQIVFEPIDTGNRRDLSLHRVGGDDYLNYLIELSKKGDDEFERAMDEIGQTDLEEIRRLLNNGDYGIVDGVSSEYRVLKLKRGQSSLEENTGMSIDTLKNCHISFGRKRRRR